MWDKLMVRVWAFFKVREYRHRVIEVATALVTGVTSVYVAVNVAMGVKVSIGVLLVLILCLPLAIYFAVVSIKEWKYGNEENES